MKYFALLTCLIFVSYLLGFVKKLEKYQWMDRNYTTSIKGVSILTVVWARIRNNATPIHCRNWCGIVPDVFWIRTRDFV